MTFPISPRASRPRFSFGRRWAALRAVRRRLLLSLLVVCAGLSTTACVDREFLEAQRQRKQQDDGSAGQDDGSKSAQDRDPGAELDAALRELESQLPAEGPSDEERTRQNARMALELIQTNTDELDDEQFEAFIEHLVENQPGMVARGGSARDDNGSGNTPGNKTAPSNPPPPTLDREEYLEKKRAYEAEQRRRDEEARRRAEEEAQFLRRRTERRDDDRIPQLGSQPKRDQEQNRVRTQRQMTTWHANYLRRIGPSKEALGRYVSALRQGDGVAEAAACRNLSSELGRALKDDNLFRSVDGVVNEALGHAFASFNRMAVACVQGRRADAKYHQEKAERHLTVAAGALQRYALSP